MKALGSLAALAIAAGLGALSCASLDSLEENTCGNGVIDTGEDCDEHVASGQSCRGAGLPMACHFECRTPDGDTFACPEGSACSLNDGICRAPGGGFTPGTSFSDPLVRVKVADFDGDGRKDALVVGPTSASILTFSPAGSIKSAFEVPVSLGNPALGPITGNPSKGASPTPDDTEADLTSDIAFASPEGVGVLVSNGSGLVVPKAYPTLIVPSPVKVLFVGIEFAFTSPKQLGSSPFLFADDPAHVAGCGIARVARSGEPLTQVAYLGRTIDKLAALVVADFAANPQAGCNEFVVAFEGDTRVNVFQPCTYGEVPGSGGLEGVIFTEDANPLDGTPWNQSVLLPPSTMVAKRAKTLSRGAFFAGDFNGDGRLDFIVDTNHGLHVAFGLGDGRFDSNNPPSLLAPDNEARRLKLGFVRSPKDNDTPDDDLGPAYPTPLAIGDLNGDGRYDFVTADGVFVSVPTEVGDDLTFTLALKFEDFLLEEAMIGDFDGNGAGDIAATARTGVPGLLYLGGSGTTGLDGLPLFDGSFIAAGGSIETLILGDFDGDAIQDLAAIERSRPPVTDDGDAPVIFFGGPGGLGEPIAMGRLSPRIDQLVPTNLNQDGVTDLTALQYVTSATVAISALVGRSDRLMFAPFGLTKDLSGDPADPELIQGRPYRVLLGQFMGDSHLDLAAFAVGTAQIGSVGAEDKSLRLWLSEGSGDALFGVVDSSDPLDELERVRDAPEKGQVAAAKLDDDDAFERVVLVTPDGDGTLLTVASAKDGVFAFDDGYPLEIPAILADGGQMELADLDGDGRVDLVLLAKDDATGVQIVLVFWNDGTQPLGNGSPSRIEIDEAFAGVDESGQKRLDILGFAVLQADADPKTREIAVLTPDRTFVVSVDGPRKFGAPVAQEGLGGGASIAAGDIDGDGLDDLLVGSGINTQVFLAVPGPFAKK